MKNHHESSSKPSNQALHQKRSITAQHIPPPSISKIPTPPRTPSHRFPRIFPSHARSSRSSGGKKASPLYICTAKRRSAHIVENPHTQQGCRERKESRARARPARGRTREATRSYGTTDGHLSISPSARLLPSSLPLETFFGAAPREPYIIIARLALASKCPESLRPEPQAHPVCTRNSSGSAENARREDARREARITRDDGMDPRRSGSPAACSLGRRRHRPWVHLIFTAACNCRRAAAPRSLLLLSERRSREEKSAETCGWFSGESWVRSSFFFFFFVSPALL